VAAAQPVTPGDSRRSSEIIADAFIKGIVENKKDYTLKALGDILKMAGVPMTLSGKKEDALRKLFKNEKAAKALLAHMLSHGKITTEPTDPMIQGWLAEVRAGGWTPPPQVQVATPNQNIRVSGVQPPVVMTSPVNVPVQSLGVYPQQSNVPREMQAFPAEQAALMARQPVVNLVSLTLRGLFEPDGTVDLKRIESTTDIVTALGNMNLVGLEHVQKMIVDYQEELLLQQPPEVQEQARKEKEELKKAKERAQAPAPARVTPVTQAPYTPQVPPPQQYAPQPTPQVPAPQQYAPQVPTQYVPQYTPQPTPTPQYAPQPQNPYTGGYAPQVQPQASYGAPTYPPATGAPYPGAVPVLPVVAGPMTAILPEGGVESGGAPDEEASSAAAIESDDEEHDDEEDIGGEDVN
jgi:hypothetical protein